MNLQFHILCCIIFASLATSSIIHNQLIDELGDELDDLGEKKCSWGPVFWCRSISNAKSCHAISHCIQTVWEKQYYQQQDQLNCKPCTEMVDLVRGKIGYESEPSQVMIDFQDSCDQMSNEDMKYYCRSLVIFFSNEMTEILNSRMSSQMVCSTANLCNQESQALNCRQCNQFQSIVAQKFTSSEKSNVLDGILNICNKMSSNDFSEASSKFVLENFEIIYEAIESSLSSKTFCQTSNICTFQTSFSNEHESTELNVEEFSCKLCELVFHHLKDQIMFNVTISQFKNNLDRFCNNQNQFANICLNTVQQFYVPLYEFASRAFDATGMCHIIGVCSKSIDHSDTQEDVILGTVVINEPEILDSSLTIEPTEIIDMITPSCWFCKLFVRATRKMLSNNSTPKDMMTCLHRVCSLFYPKSAEICKAFEDKYALKLVQLLHKPLDAEQVCAELSICQKSMKKVDNDSEAADAVEVELIDDRTDRKNKLGCRICKLTMKITKYILGNNSSKEQITHALHSTCGRMKTFNKLCRKFMNKYSTKLIEKLQKRMNAKQICASLKICSTLDTHNSFDSQEEYRVNYSILFNRIGVLEELDEISKKVRKEEDFDESQSCMICEFVVNKFDKILADPSTEKRCKSGMQHFCSLLPQMMQKQCFDYTQQYFDFAFEFLEQFLKPKQVCGTLHLCPISDSNSANQEFTAEEKTETVAFDNNAIPITDGSNFELISSLENQDQTDDTSIYDLDSTEGISPCRICLSLVKLVRKSLGHRNSKVAIKKALHLACGRMGFYIRIPCNVLVRHLSGPLVDLIQSGLGSSQVCRRVQLCSSMNLKQYLMDGHTEEMDEKNENMGNTQICVACELFVAKFKSIMTDPSFENTLKTKMHDMCMKFSNDLQQHCLDYTQRYFELGFELLRQFTAKINICSSMHLCPTSNTYSLNQTASKPCEDDCENEEAEKNLSDSVSCKACRAEVEKFADFAYDQTLTTQDHVEVLKIKLCDTNGDPKFYQYCLGMVDTFVTGIITWLISSTKSGDFCYNLGVCSN